MNICLLLTTVEGILEDVLLPIELMKMPLLLTHAMMVGSTSNLDKIKPPKCRDKKKARFVNSSRKYDEDYPMDLGFCPKSIQCKIYQYAVAEAWLFVAHTNLHLHSISNEANPNLLPRQTSMIPSYNRSV